MGDLKFNGIEHFDRFDDETVFWIDLSNLPKEIEEKARAIDGDAYNRDCFGMCVFHDAKSGQFQTVTDTDWETGDSRSVYYIDNEGDKHWFSMDIPEETLRQVYSACEKVNRGEMAVQGYEIKKTALFENGRGVALAENPKAPQPFVTWMFTQEKNGRRDYEWGHYYADRGRAEKDFTTRVDEYAKDYQMRPRFESLETYKYYSTQRPVDIGTFPKPPHNAPDEIVNYEGRTWVEKDTRLAWGHLTYTRPLTEQEAADYELRPSRENPDIKQQMEKQAQVVGKWEDAHRVPDQKRLTWFYPDFGSYVVKEYVAPERLAEAAKGIEHQKADRAHRQKKGRQPIADQLKAAQKEAQEHQGPEVPKKKTPDRGER